MNTLIVISICILVALWTIYSELHKFNDRQRRWDEERDNKAQEQYKEMMKRLVDIACYLETPEHKEARVKKANEEVSKMFEERFKQWEEEDKLKASQKNKKDKE